MSKMPDTWQEANAWAMERIGKRVYRPSFGCKCAFCTTVVNHGITIADEMQAMYMTDCAMEMGYRYYDTKEEAAE